MKLVLSAVTVTTLLFTSSAFAGQSKSPIFGDADATPTSVAKNKAIIGKGAYADYWGYYGNLYSSYANSYGNYGYGGSEGSSGNATYYYYNAYLYANQATNAYANAYYFAYYGY